jgi:hypothetical protein
LASNAAAVVIAACLGGLLAAPQATAGEIGHYVAGGALIRDYLVPPPGFYYEQYNVFYTTDTFKDSNGDKVNSIQVGGQTVDLDVDVDVYGIIPAFLYITDWKVLGASYGFFAAPYFGTTSVAASLETSTEFGRATDEDQFGLGDLYLRPIWLGWHLGQWDVAAGYGLYVPIGKYDADDVDNIGLGMWTHEFQLAGAYYFDEQQTTALTMAGTYEIHHTKDDVDIRPGSHFTLDYGLSHNVPLTEDLLGEIGITGYGQWQVTDDSGSDAVNKDVRDRVFGIGFQAGLTFLPYRAALVFRYLHEFEAEDRFEGDLFTLTLMKSF